jgi:pimeloyl-ACP methyl ester carboxylesterase
MESRHRRRIGIASAAAGLGAASLGAAMGIRKIAVGRVRLRPDPDATEPFGSLRGTPLTVLADDGLPLHVEIDGKDDAPLTVLFTHGYCLNQDSWHYQRRDLGTKHAGLRMVFWDQRSHGRSGRSNPLHASIDQTGADLYAVLRATVGPGEPVVLVGHSMGAMTIMALADKHPELFGDPPMAAPRGRREGARVIGIVMANTSSGDMGEMTLGLPLMLAKLVRPLAPGVIRGLSRRAEFVDWTRQAGADLAFIMIRRMGFADKHVSPRMVDFVEQMIRGTTIDVIAEFYPSLMTHDKVKALEVLGRVPTVVLTGGEDRLTPAAHGRAIAAAIADTELVEVAEAGHLLPLEYPGIVTAAIRRLIGRADSAAKERLA